ncbi:MAG: HEAT repeat domain-containing protein [Pseudomonadota bacterium]|nr:HEAT repeat domain-containing protein [Pseudomonadota bacterium]
MWVVLLAVSLASFSVRPAYAGVPEDVVGAADTDMPTELRKAAFDRLATPENVAALTRLGDAADTPKPQRWVVIRALGPIGNDEARVALLHFLAAKDASARMAALGAIGDRGDRTLSGYAAARLADPALLVRAAAADALARLGDPGTLSDLERALQDPTNHYRGASLWFRRHLVDAMGAIGTEAATPYLARALDDTDTTVVTAAVAGLEKVAGFSYGEGRTPEQELAAWKRWAGR